MHDADRAGKTDNDRPDRNGVSRRAVLGGGLGAVAGAGIGALALPQQAYAASPDGNQSALAKAARYRKARTMILEPSAVLVYRDGDIDVVSDHSVVIQDGRVAEIVEGRVPGPNNARLDLTGQLLMPGLISGHTHVSLGSPTRGLIESGRSFGPPGLLVDALNNDDLDALNAYNLAEILRAGCTTQLNQALTLHDSKSYVRVARNWGVRGYPGGMVPSWPRTTPIRGRQDDSVLFESVPETLQEIQAELDFGLSIMGAEDGRIMPMISPHGPETHTPETLTATLDAARQLGTGIHTHLATALSDSRNVERVWGKPPVQWIDDYGWYDVPIFGAHLSAWNPVTDAPFLAGKENFTFAHAPVASSVVGFGGATGPFVEALAAGINVNVALDSHGNDLLDAAKIAVLAGRARRNSLNATSPVPMKWPTPWDLAKSVTINPANGLGRADLGRIEVGALADLVSVDISGLLVGSGAAGPEPINNLIYASGSMVRNVMTQGVIQVMDGHLVVDDEARIISRGAEVVRSIWAQLERDGYFTPMPR